MKTKLTIEESARLIELGVDAKLASKCQVQHEADFEVEYRIVPHDEFCYEMASLNPQPIFDLSDLLSILPKEIKQEDRHPMTVVYYWNSTKKEWIAYYDYVENTIMASASELIDSLNQLAIWCLENGHLKTERK